MSEDNNVSNLDLAKTEEEVAERVLKRKAAAYLKEWEEAKEVLKQAQQDCALKEKR